MKPRPGLYIALLAAIASCSRYEWVPDYLSPECASYHRPVHRLVDIAASLETADPSVVSGRVVAKDSHQPVGDARVVLRRNSVRAFVTDSTGRFHIGGLHPGRYELDVRRIGYDRTQDSISVPVPSGHELVIQLQPTGLDGPCSGFGVLRVRKPWWKFW